MARPSHQSGRFRWWLPPLLLILVAAAVLGDAAYEIQLPLNIPPDEIIELRPGEPLRALLTRMTTSAYLNPRQALYLGLWTRINVRARSIRAGEYAVPAGSRCIDLLRLLQSGKVVLREVRFIEGWRFDQALQALADNPYVDHSQQAHDTAALMRQLGSANQSPEGRFFPDTYRFAKGTSDVTVLHQAYQSMSRHLEELWAGRAADAPYASAEEALIMASLVEKETGVDGERAQIAGVFVRRLRLHMRLQTDPSVIYGMGERFDGNLRLADLHADTPYNTYTRDGLPPTPICLPGEASLRAALHPDSGNTLYFVSRGDGTHQFSATLEEHNAAVRRYQLGGRHGG